MTTGTQTQRLKIEKRHRTLVMLLGFICSLILTISLVLIYYSTNQSNMVLLAGIIIVLLSVILVVTGGLREVVLLLFLTLFTSTISIAIFSAEYVQPFPYLLPLAWLLFLVIMIIMGWNTPLKIYADRYMVVQNKWNGLLRVMTDSVEPPLIPGLERVMAYMPATSLSAGVSVKDVRLPGPDYELVPTVKVSVNYRLVDPVKLYNSISNREQTLHETLKPYQDVIKDLGKPKVEKLEDAMLDTLFWKIVIDKQISGPVMGAVRNALAGDQDVLKPRQVLEVRSAIRNKVEESIKNTFFNKGIELTGVNISDIELQELLDKEEQRKAAEKNKLDAARYTAFINGIMEPLEKRISISTDEEREGLKKLITQAILDASEDQIVDRVKKELKNS